MVFSVCLPVIGWTNDTGVFEYFLNIDAKLPALESAITPEAAVEAVEDRMKMIQSGEGSDEPGMEAYWADFREVLSTYNEVTQAKPVFVGTGDKKIVARFLVGVNVNGAVGGFFSVDPVNCSIQNDLMWDSNLKPLWLVPASVWNKAESVNDIVSLVELVPPFEQFTTGIPVDPFDPSLFIVDGVAGCLFAKTQEERSERVNWLNNEYGTDFKISISNHEGRRTGTSKCMSIASSYMADWWTVRTGRELPAYTNAIGGQKEYGYNPRLLECRFFQKAKNNHFLGKYIGNFKIAPGGKDRVTGEKIPYSPRGYGRILTETDKGQTPDALVPGAVSYATEDNHFAMDGKPHIAQIFIDGLFPKLAIKRDLKNAEDKDFPFTLMSDYGARVDVDYITKMLQTWGPLYGQHMGRNDDGSPKVGRFGMGVHCVMIVGTGVVNDLPMVIYRDTFGGGSKDYLEDSFTGPEFRAMPIEYFYQAIAFPHRLYLTIDNLKTGNDASLTGVVAVRTNRNSDLVDVDSLKVFVDGELAPQARLNNLEKGKYRLWLPATESGAGSIEIQGEKKYFADKDGNSVFSIKVHKDGEKWSVETD